jgi:hypothetical protein
VEIGRAGDIAADRIGLVLEGGDAPHPSKIRGRATVSGVIS